MTKNYPALGKILRKLLFDRGMKAADLAREVHLPPPTVHRLVTGKSTRPYESSLKPIADFFSLTIDELTGDVPLHAENNPGIDKSIINKSISYLPVVSWQSIPDENFDRKICDQAPFAGTIGSDAFATIINDSSMEPVFPRGSMLIFDPVKSPKDRSYVLVLPHNATIPIFRQLIIDYDHKYLKPLNPDLNAFRMRLLGEDDKIIASLVEARQNYTE